MKTPEQIAKECADEIFNDVRFGQPAYAWPEPIIAKHINEALAQERERTCEWEGEMVYGEREFVSKCDFGFVENDFKLFKFCPNCGGKIVVKPPSADANEMGREG